MSPRVIDERRVKHEEARWGGADGNFPRSDLPQFTLRGLLAFFTAITVCLSLGATAARVLQVRFDLGVLLFGLTAVLTWIVLCATYQSLRLQAAIGVHFAGPAFAFGLALLTELGTMASYPSAFRFHPGALLFRFFFVLSGCCVLGCVLSLPVFVVTMIGLLLKSALRRHR